MLLVSVPSLDFSPDEKLQSFTITNTKQSPFLFKVKTNNVNAIDAKPCIGSIQPNENIKITVRRNSTSTEQVKLQITYTECPEELTKENFKQLWNKYSKSQQSEIMNIRVIKKEENEAQNAEKQDQQADESEDKSNKLPLLVKKQSEKTEEEFISQLHIQEQKKQPKTQSNLDFKDPSTFKESKKGEKKEEKKEKNEERKEEKNENEKKVETRIRNVQIGNLFQISPLTLAFMFIFIFYVGYKFGQNSLV